MIETARRRLRRPLLALIRQTALALALAAPAWHAWGAEATPTDCPPVARQPDPAALVQAAQHARDHGFLWRLRRDGRVSWLYGTIHVGRLDWAFPGPQVATALDQAQLLALELDVGAAEVEQQLAVALARLEAQRPSPPLSPALAQRLTRQLALACLSPALMAGQSPLMQVVTLSVLSARRDGLDPAYAQEFMLAGYAHALGRPVVSLEDAAGQLEALRGGGATEELTLLTQSLDQLDSGHARATLVRLAQAWADGDLDTLAHYEQWCDCAHNDAERAFLARLNDDRNPTLAGRIEALHAGGKSVFAAIGALHMTGPRALPSLLRQRGFEVDPVALTRD